MPFKAQNDLIALTGLGASGDGFRRMIGAKAASE
jgi:hypothetical protein